MITASNIDVRLDNLTMDVLDSAMFQCRQNQVHTSF